MPIYHAGLQTLGNDFLPKTPIKGKAWRIHYSDVKIPNYFANSKTKKILIEAPSLGRAQYASDLISAAFCLIDGRYPSRNKIKIYDENNPDDDSLEDRDDSFGTWGPEMRGGVSLACLVAAKISLFPICSPVILLITEEIDFSPKLGMI